MLVVFACVCPAWATGIEDTTLFQGVQYMFRLSGPLRASLPLSDRQVGEAC